MKKLALLFGFCVLLGSMLYFKQEEKKTPYATVVQKVSGSEKKDERKEEMKEDEKVTSKSKEEKRFPATKIRREKEDLLENFDKTTLTFFDHSLLLVEGVTATFNKIPMMKEVAQMGRFFIYEGKTQEGYPVVYSPEKKAYGYFTGEVIVSGEFQKALDVIEGKSFEVLYKNDVTEQIIFKVEDLQDLSSLDELKSIPKVKVEADVKFTRIM